MTSRSSRKTFTPSQIEKLRQQYGAIEKIDPDSFAYTMLIAWLDSSEQALLRQLARSNIKFVSPLARNRVRSVA